MQRNRFPLDNKFSLLILIGILALFSCEESISSATEDSIQAVALGDTVAFGQGDDSLWVWWSHNADLDGDGVADHALMCLPGPNLTGDTLTVDYLNDNAWSRIGAIALVKGRQAGMLVMIQPAGPYDFRLTWKRMSQDSAVAAASSNFQMLQQVPILSEP